MKGCQKSCETRTEVTESVCDLASPSTWIPLECLHKIDETKSTRKLKVKQIFILHDSLAEKETSTKVRLATLISVLFYNMILEGLGICRMTFSKSNRFTRTKRSIFTEVSLFQFVLCISWNKYNAIQFKWSCIRFIRFKGQTELTSSKGLLSVTWPSIKHWPSHLKGQTDVWSIASFSMTCDFKIPYLNFKDLIDPPQSGPLIIALKL